MLVTNFTCAFQSNKKVTPTTITPVIYSGQGGVLNMEFKDKLKEIRTANGLSQQALADAIHISRSAIAKWENGLGDPSDDAMEALTTYLGVDSKFFAADTKESHINTASTKSATRSSNIFQKSCTYFTIIVSVILLLFGCFCLLTQWKCIALPMKGISVKEIYRFPDGRLYYQLDAVSDRVWCSEWEFMVTEDGCCYKIPKRSIIELYKDTQNNQLKMDQLLDSKEQNAANEKAGLPQITKWYLGKPGDAILIYEDGMDVPSASRSLLLKYGYDKLIILD